MAMNDIAYDILLATGIRHRHRRRAVADARWQVRRHLRWPGPSAPAVRRQRLCTFGQKVLPVLGSALPVAPVPVGWLASVLPVG
jgi:hypothetical protein